MSKAPLADCDTCPLQPQPFVPGHGLEQADVVVVGEAPGAEEVKKGEPFVGRSGELLKKVLTYHKLDPEKVYYTNACLCRPPLNDDGKQEPPKAKAIKACRDRLIAEVKSRNPKFVIALGAVAAKSVLGTKDGITILRKGRPHVTKELPQAQVIPTFHTANALRNPDNFPSIVSDIGKMTRIEVGWEPTKHKVATPGNALALLKDQLGHSEMLAADAEWGKPYNDFHNPKFLCIGISERPGKAVVYPVEVLPYIKATLNEGFRDKRWLWQNGKSDIKILWGLGMLNAKVDEDTLLAHYATNEIKGTHDLEQIATEKIGAPYWKQEAKADAEDENLESLPLETLYLYNATDADVTHRLLKPLHDEMKSDGVFGVYNDLLIPASAAIAPMEWRGMRVDLEKLSEIEEQTLAEMETCEAPLSEWVDNPRSPMQVMKTLEGLGFNVFDTTALTLSYIDHPFVDKLLAYRKVQKLYSTYLRGLRKNILRGRVHPSFLLHGTETGRTSCRKPNLQNQPIDHPVRECFTASEGHVLIEADYAGIEMRVMATVSGDAELRKRFIEGRNPNKELAVELFGVDYTPRQYVNTKSVNYGTLYMERPKHLAARLHMDAWVAQKIQHALFQRFPGIKRYHRDTIKAIREDQHLTSLYGRKRRFWLITQENAYDIYKEGANFKISSPASDILLSALIKIHREKPYLNPIVNVHDALIFDVPEEHGEEAMREVVEIMESVNPLDVPLIAEAERSFRWKMKSS